MKDVTIYLPDPTFDRLKQRLVLTLLAIWLVDGLMWLFISHNETALEVLPRFLHESWAPWAKVALPFLCLIGWVWTRHNQAPRVTYGDRGGWSSSDVAR